jgi:integrase
MVMAIKVNLTKRVLINGKDRYCPVVVSANGRLKPDWVLVDKVETRFPGGVYYIDWTDKGSRRRQSVGSDGTVAYNRQLRKQAEMDAQASGVVVVSSSAGPKLTPLAESIAEYLEEIEVSKKPKTFSAYSNSLKFFQESCTKKHLEEIDRRDMLRFSAFLRDEKEHADRTVYNNFDNVMIYLKVSGNHRFLNKNDWPKFTEEEVEIYTKEALDNLLKVCTKEEKLWWTFFLKTGMREQEVIYMAWRNVDFERGTVSVRHKPEWNWKPKAYREREIPTSLSLIEELREICPKNPGKALMFPTGSGKPKMDFLHCLKACVRRAGLDEEDYYLHKFRATFATWSLRSRVDIRTVQEWLGHRDIESTMRYLQPARGDEAREFMNQVFD